MTDKTRSITEIVAKYLRNNPDFLIQNPEVLEIIQLHHATGPAISLIERQVEHLRKQNLASNQQLKRLVQTADENQRLMLRLHELTLELMVMNDLGQFFDHLSEALKTEFNADILNITLFERKIKAGSDTPVFRVRREDAGVQQFDEQLQKGDTVCGRMNSDKLDFLFGNRARWVQSAVLVPLGTDGLLAIGSSDETHFYPGMGTLFLDLLANVVTNRLALDEPEKQRRSA
jgi:uncharacterized protein YigA (DUF484 family)